MKYLTILLLLTLTGCLRPDVRELAEKSYELGCLTAFNKSYDIAHPNEHVNFSYVDFCHDQSKTFLDK